MRIRQTNRPERRALQKRPDHKQKGEIIQSPSKGGHWNIDTTMKKKETEGHTHDTRTRGLGKRKEKKEKKTERESREAV